jgi:pimeloyl-ACP methyl ester carboxylesterase
MSTKGPPMSAPAKPVVLLLPGLMCDAGIWSRQIEALSAAYDVRVPDFFGLESMQAMAQASLALAEGPLAVAGHSMGGRVAMQMAAMAPDRIARLCLMDTGAHPVAPGEAAKRQVLLDVADAEGMDGVVRDWLPPMVAPDRLADRPLMDELEALVRRASVAVLKGQTRALLTRADGLEQLKAVTCPTAFVAGDLDLWSPPQQHAEMQALVAGSTLTVIPDCGHMAPAERPEAVTHALQQWLSQP